MANFLHWDYIKLLFFIACFVFFIYRFLSVGRKHALFSKKPKSLSSLKMKASKRKMHFNTDELDSTDPTSISSWLDEHK